MALRERETHEEDDHRRHRRRAPQRSLLGAGAANADVYYKNCSEARDAGVTPLYEGDPGYAPHLDRDNDGIACE